MEVKYVGRILQTNLDSVVSKVLGVLSLKIIFYITMVRAVPLRKSK
jgi:hypothetical protein